MSIRGPTFVTGESQGPELKRKQNTNTNTMETTNVAVAKVTKENVQVALDKIAEFAKDRKLEVKGDLTLKTEPKFPSKNQHDKFRNRMNRLVKRPRMGQANLFLRHLAKYADGFDAKLVFSEKELTIKRAKKEWKDANAKAEALLKAYKDEKGDYYKS